LRNTAKVKELEKLLAKKREEYRQVVAHFKAKKILSKEASKLLGNIKEEIAKIEKDIKRVKK